MQQPPLYQPPQQQSYWTGKHVTGVLLLLGSMGAGVLFFLFGFALIVPWCFLPFIAGAGIIGLVLLF